MLLHLTDHLGAFYGVQLPSFCIVLSEQNVYDIDWFAPLRPTRGNHARSGFGGSNNRDAVIWQL
jgi:hypothetical protein